MTLLLCSHKGEEEYPVDVYIHLPTHLHCACVPVSDLYVKLCTGVTYYIIHTIISENIGLVWLKVCKPRMVHTYLSPTNTLHCTDPVLSPMLFIPSLYYTSYNSKNFNSLLPFSMTLCASKWNRGSMMKHDIVIETPGWPHNNIP